MHKCSYCDFNSHAVEHSDRAYADAIIRELDHRVSEHPWGPFSTLYFGGGTPSLWAPEQLSRVIEAIRTRCGLKPGAEITLEANPGSALPRQLEGYVHAGVNRFSIGVQSFLSDELLQLDRIHKVEDAENAVSAAMKLVDRVSLDLIYGLPHQSWDQVQRSLDRAIALGPEHISAYTLTIEPDTVLGRQTAQGLFHPMDDDAQAELIERVTDHLGDAGYSRYEISNYAREEGFSKHNSLYWVGAAYLGLGAGAHSYLPRYVEGRLRGARRWANIKSPNEYLQTAQHPRTYVDDQLDQAQAVADLLLVGFRPRWGLNLGWLEQSTGIDYRAQLQPGIDSLVRKGLLNWRPPWLVPSAQGFLFNNTIVSTLVANLTSP